MVNKPEDHVREVFSGAHRGEEGSELFRCDSALFLFSVFRIVSPGTWSWTSWDTWSYLVPVKISPPCCLSWTHRCVIFIWYHAWIWKYRNPNDNTKIISWAINSGNLLLRIIIIMIIIVITSTPPLLTTYIQSSMSSPAFSSCRLLTLTLVITMTGWYWRWSWSSINDHGDGLTTMMMLVIICNGDQMFETDHKEKVLMIISLPSRAWPSTSHLKNEVQGVFVLFSALVGIHSHR